MRGRLLAIIAALLVIVGFAHWTGRGRQAPRGVVDANTTVPARTRTELELEGAVVPSRARPFDIQDLSHSSRPVPGAFEGTLQTFTNGRPDESDHDGVITFDVIRVGALSTRAVRIDVSEGHWSAKLGDGETWRASHFIAHGGRLGTPRSFVLGPAGTHGCTLEVDWNAGTLLHVVDHATGVELADVRLALTGAQSGPDSADPIVPSVANAEEVRRFRGPSPLQLPCVQGDYEAWIQAEGFETRRIRLTGCEGERTVRLRPGQYIECRVIDRAAEPGPLYVRVRSAERPEWIVIADVLATKNDTVVLGPVAVGRFLVSLEQAGDVKVGRTLDHRPVDVEVREPAGVTLSAGAGVVERNSGSLIIQLSGDMGAVSGFSISARSRSPFAQPPLGFAADDKRFRVGAGRYAIPRLLPGDYALEVKPAIESRVLHIVAGSAQELQVLVPRLCRVAVSAVNEASGDRLAGASVMVRGLGANSVTAWFAMTDKDGEGRPTALVAPGLVEIAVRSELHVTAKRVVELHEGDNELRVALANSMRVPIRMTFLDGSANVRVDPSLWPGIRLQPVAPCQGAVIQVGADDDPRSSSTLTVFVDAPGRYRITFPELPYFEQVAEMEVDAKSSEGIACTVQLVPL